VPSPAERKKSTFVRCLWGIPRPIPIVWAAPQITNWAFCSFC